jgi:hypothetical protein
MIKKLSILLFVIVVMTQVIGLSAANVTVLKYDPDLDGVISDGEWPEEGKFVLDKATVDSYAGCWAGEMTAAQKTTFYFLWADDGLYVAADIKDSTIVAPTSWDAHGADGGPSADAFQLNLFAHDLARWFTIGTYADGKLAARTHYGDVSDLSDIVKGKGTLTSDGYVIEAKIPWSCIVDGENIDYKDGLSIPVLFTYMDRYDGGEVCYKSMDAAVWPPLDTIDNFLVLGGAYTPPVEEVVAVEAPAAEAAAPAEAAPVAAAPVAAPQTGDFTIVMAGMLMAIAGLTIVILKKKSVK